MLYSLLNDGSKLKINTVQTSLTFQKGIVH